MSSILIYLIGRPGTGKLSIARELSSVWDYLILDNHLINNPIFSLIPPGVKLSALVWRSIDRIRASVLDFIAQQSEGNYVLTNVLYNTPSDRRIYAQVEETAHYRKSLLIPFVLDISPEERAKRIQSPDRKPLYKTTHPNSLDDTLSLLAPCHPHTTHLDVTELTATEVAHSIQERVLSVLSSLL
jgi:shikimate kinase